MTIGRITQRMLIDKVLYNIHQNTNALSIFQQQLASGKMFSRASDDPIRFQSALDFRTRLSGERQILRNIENANTGLAISETELRNMTNVIQRAQELALSSSNGVLGQDSLDHIANEVEELLQQAVQIANRRSSSGYIFAGDQTQKVPFTLVDSATGRYVVYEGDLGARNVEIGQGAEINSSLNGIEAFFSRRHSATASFAVSDPTAALAGELAGSLPAATSGDFTINGTSFTVNLAVDSLEDVRDMINLARIDVEAEIDDGGRLVLSSNRSIDYTAESGTSNILESLGLFERVEGSAIGAGITPATTMAALGISPEGLQITVDGTTVHVDLSGAATVADVIAAINGSGLPITAEINAAADGLTIMANENVADFEILNDRVVRGSALGPITASTTLAAAGVVPPPLTSIEINNGGTARTIDLSTATTIGDVLTAINNSGADVTAEINAAGNGINIISNLDQDDLATLSINEVGAGSSAAQIGILGSVSGDTADDLGIAGEGQSLRTEGSNIFDNLVNMLAALNDPAGNPGVLADVIDKLGITLDGNLDSVAMIGGRTNRLDMARSRSEQNELFMISMISENEDADIALTASQLAMQESVLNASLNAAARTIQPTLLNFLSIT